MMKNKKCKKSMSLQRRHKKSKYAAISAAMGEKEPQEAIEKIGVIYKEGQEKMKQSIHEKELIKILESQNTDMKPKELPDTQDSVKMAMNRGARKSIIASSFLKNSLGDNSILDKKFHGAEISFERGITGIQRIGGNSSNKKNEFREFMMDQLQHDHLSKKSARARRDSKRRDSKTSYTLPILTSKNEKLNSAYAREKRKLELEMLKLNSKLGTTAKILNLIRYEKSPTPNYKYKYFKERIALINKYQSKMKKKGTNIDKFLLGDDYKNKTANKNNDNSESSIITEDVEPTESNVSF